jgi:hypothetical protein
MPNNSATAPQPKTPGPRLVQPPAPAELSPVAPAEYPHIKPGVYDAEVLSAGISLDRRYHRWVCALKFRVVPDGITLFGFLNCGSGEKPRAGGRRSAFFRAWSIANGSAPHRGQVMSPRAFKNKLFQIRIGNVLSDYLQRAQSPYSVVREIIRRLP